MARLAPPPARVLLVLSDVARADRLEAEFGELDIAAQSAWSLPEAAAALVGAAYGAVVLDPEVDDLGTGSFVEWLTRRSGAPTIVMEEEGGVQEPAGGEGRGAEVDEVVRQVFRCLKLRHGREST